MRRQVALDAATPPSVAMVTLQDAAGQLCSAAISNDSSIVAAGFADGILRLAMLKEMTAASSGAPKKSKKAKGREPEVPDLYRAHQPWAQCDPHAHQLLALCDPHAHRPWALM